MPAMPWKKPGLRRLLRQLHRSLRGAVCGAVRRNGQRQEARIDSALACSLTSRLIKSGISLSAVLETVNTSLMVKSADESFATLDICRIDLNSGEAVIYKAGAAATYIKSGDRMSRCFPHSR